MLNWTEFAGIKLDDWPVLGVARRDASSSVGRRGDGDGDAAPPSGLGPFPPLQGGEKLGLPGARFRVAHPHARDHPMRRGDRRRRARRRADRARARTKRPDVEIRLIEPGAIGGEHVWSFFAATWRKPTAGSPRRSSVIAGPATTSRFRGTAARSTRAIIRSNPNASPASSPTRLTPGQLIAEKAIAVGAGAVVLADGDRVEAGGVIDARGAADMTTLDLGWQKFVGRELVLPSRTASSGRW